MGDSDWDFYLPATIEPVGSGEPDTTDEVVEVVVAEVVLDEVVVDEVVVAEEVVAATNTADVGTVEEWAAWNAKDNVVDDGAPVAGHHEEPETSTVGFDNDYDE